MNLRKLIDIIDGTLEFELYTDRRIGVFSVDDKGISDYLDYDVLEIKIREKRFVIELDY